MAEATFSGATKKASGYPARHLLNYMETICACIESSEDFQSLMDILAKEGLISVSLMWELTCMPEIVLHRSKCRYLLWSVYNTIRRMNDGFDNFLVALSKLNLGRRLAYDYYQKQHWYGSFTVMILKNKKKGQIYELLKKMFSDSSDLSDTPRTELSNVSIQYELRTVNESDKPFIVLLDAKIAAHEIEHKLCSWTKNGKILNCDAFPIIRVQVADITAEGTYNFLLSGTTFMTIELKVNSSIDPYNSVLVERYLHNDVVSAEYPPVSQTEYINLAVIQSKAKQPINICMPKFIRGDPDDIHKPKGEINYKEAFEDIKHGEVVIVEGRPGSGKTTLAYKISKDWANMVSHSDTRKSEEVKWKHVRALFLIHLRGFCGNPDIKLVDLVKCYYSNEQTIKIICDYVTLKEGAGVCFILDGLDEYQPANRSNFIFKLIKKKVLSKSIVIVASRPAAVAKYRLAKKRIEVLGFFKEQISEYIDTYNFSGKSLNPKYRLKQYLEERPNVYHMCYLPIQLAIVCLLFDITQGTLPETETAIYAEFTKHTILKSLYRENSEGYINSIFTLPEPENEVFSKICTLAFNKTLSSKQVLEQSEVDLVCKRMNSSFGLVTIDCALTKCGFQKLYTFCHLTLQEFLAACHIFMAKELHQRQLIETSSQMEHMVVVLKFFCGLADFGPDGILFKRVINSEHFNCLSKIQCAFESQQESTCNYLADENSLSLKETFFSVRDWTALGFVLINADENCTKKLSLTLNSISEEALVALKKKTQGKKEKLKVEVLCVSGITNRLLTPFIRIFSSLSIICISDIHHNLESIIFLLCEVENPNLKIIYFKEKGLSKLILSADFKNLIKSLVPLSSSVVKGTSCPFVLLDIIQSCFEKQSIFFMKELARICSSMCFLTPCVKVTNINLHEAILIDGNLSFDDMEQEIQHINNKIVDPTSCATSLFYCNYIKVGSYLVVLWLDITTLKLLIFPQDSSFSSLIKPSVLIVDWLYVDKVWKYLEPLLRIPSSFLTQRKLYIFCLNNFNLNNLRLPYIFSNFHISSEFSEVNNLTKFMEDLQSLADASNHSSSIFFPKIKKLLQYCSSFTQVNLGESDGAVCTSKNCIEVENIILSCDIDGLPSSWICTSSLVPLNWYKLKLSSAVSHGNHLNLKLFQFKVLEYIILIIEFPFIHMMKCLLYSSLQSYKKGNRTSCASLLVDIILNCCDIYHGGPLVAELHILCSAMCGTCSCVKLTLIQRFISDDVYMVCEVLKKSDVGKEIEGVSIKPPCSEDNFNNSLLHFCSFIPMEHLMIAIYLEITNSSTDYRIYIFHRDCVGHLDLSNTNTARPDNQFLDRLREFVAH